MKSRRATSDRERIENIDLKTKFSSSTFLMLGKFCLCAISWEKNQTQLHIVVLITPSLVRMLKEFQENPSKCQTEWVKLKQCQGAISVRWWARARMCVRGRDFSSQLCYWNGIVYTYSMRFCALIVKFTFDHTKLDVDIVVVSAGEKAFDWQNLQFTTKT